MRRGTDWGFVIVLAVGILVSWAFILQEGIPQTSATEALLYQANDLVAGFSEGTLYARWSPHVLLGYGAPVPHYSPPAPAYSLALLDVLFVSNLERTLRIGFVALLLMLATATYSLVLRHSNARAAVLASVLMLTSPYISLTLPHINGNYAELMGITLLVSSLWAIDRWLYAQTRTHWLLCMGNSTLLVLTSPTQHAPVALGLSLVLIGYYAHTQQTTRVIRWGIVMLLGVACLSAFYTLPAHSEQHDVTWLSYYTLNPNPITPEKLLALPQAIRTSTAITPPQLSLGTVPLLGAGMALLALIKRRQATRLGAIGGMLFIVCMVALWQSPHAHGWLGICALALALFITPLFPAQDNRLSRLFFVASFSSLLIGALPIWLSTPPRYTYTPPTPLTAIRHEQQGYGVIAVPLHAGVPSTITPDNALTLSYQANNPNRLLVQSVLTDQISILSKGNQVYRYQVRIRQPLEMQFLVAPFAGWQATLNDITLPIQAHPTRGYLLNVPPIINGTLTLTLNDTPVRSLAWGISGLGLLAIASVSIWLGTRQNTPARLLRYQLLDNASVRLLAVVLLLCMLFLGAFITQILPKPAYVFPQAVPTIRTDSGLNLVRYSITHTRTPLQHNLSLALDWAVVRTVGSNYFVRFSVRDVTRSDAVTTTTTMLLGNYPSKRWQRGQIIQEVYTIPLPIDLASGRYAITMRLVPCTPYMHECDDGASVSFFDASGQPRGNVFTLPNLLTIE